MIHLYNSRSTIQYLSHKFNPKQHISDSQEPYVSTHAPMEFQDIQVSKITTSSATPQVQEDNQIASPTLAKPLSPLVDIESTPISASIMKTSPSNIINKEVQKTSIVDPLNTSAQASGFESPSRFTALGDVEEAPDKPMSSLGLTTDLREIRPPIKYQDLEWKNVRGRGKCGCRGRGNTC